MSYLFLESLFPILLRVVACPIHPVENQCSDSCSIKTQLLIGRVNLAFTPLNVPR